jgi:FkbM family methyltransferase
MLRCLLATGGLPKYALGRNDYAANVARVVDLAGFIDDYTSETSFLGKPVVRMEVVPPDATVVSCVVDAKPQTALARLRAAGFTSVMDYFTLARLSSGLVEPPAYLKGASEDIRSHLGYYQWLDGRLADDLSRQSLRKVVSFRGSSDLTHMQGFSMAVHRQYFEDFIQFSEGEVFVDGGAFDGQTALAFRDHCPDYQAMHIFEPSPVPMEITRQKLSILPRVEFIQKGLFDCQTRLRFDSGAGSASRISDAGGSEIEVTTLDEAVREPVSFVKLDVEGAECRALQGARRHILQNHPKLAVCVYHQQSDFWRVPAIILNLRNDYEVYLRHYTEGVLETVMFFVPTPDSGNQCHPTPPPLPT